MKTVMNPYWHELDSTGRGCAKSCPACLWVEQFEATGDTRSALDLTAEELNARFEDHFGS